jgi:predicted O-linked N-acetylglucosamine transferase (SPINDLY family)
MSAVAQVKLLWRNGRRQEALRMCQGLATGQLPIRAEALALLAEMHTAVGRPDQALSTLQQLSKLTPQDAAVWRRLGYAELSRGACTEAVAAYSRAIELDPDCARAHNNLGQALMRLERRAEAIASYRRATQLDPRHATSHNNLGIALFEQGDVEAALESYRRALAHDGKLAQAHHNLGNALLRLQRPQEAVECYDRALEMQPALVAALISKGDTLTGLKRPAEALGAYQRAMQLEPRDTRLLHKAAVLLSVLSRFEESLACCDRILAVRPDDAPALTGRAYALRQLHRYEEALVVCERALGIEPLIPQALCTRAEILIAMGQQSAAHDCLLKILERDTDRADMRTLLLMNHLPQIPRSAVEVEATRVSFAAHFTQFEQWLQANPQIEADTVVGSATPFLLAYHETSNRDLLSRHGKLCCDLMSRLQLEPPTTRASVKVRVGIASAHIRDHSVYQALVKGWLGQLDRQRLEVGVLHLGVLQDDDTRWAKAHSDFFIEGVRPLREWAQTIQHLSLDVLIYPEIGMHSLTLQLASLRLAPNQLAAWGHPETTGLPTIDYYLSAQDFEPTDAQEYYSEKLQPLPNLGCYYEPYGLAPAAADLSEWGIDAHRPVLICGGMPFKYAPQHDHLFPEIARRIGSCTFVFFTAPIPRVSDMLRDRLAGAFRAGGLDPADYLTFVPWQPAAQFFGLLRQATALLDTVGFSGFNTIMQAIECDLPVAAFEGRFMRGRLGSGIMQRAGLPDLIARTGPEYIELVVRLATDDTFRRDVRKRLESGKEHLFRDGAAVAGLAEFLVGLAP